MLNKTTHKVSLMAAVAVVLLLGWAILAQARPEKLARSGDLRGAGTSLVRGGTGAPSFAPVITKFGFFWRDGGGGFECLALASSVQAGKPGSGNFDTNAMYVTGSLASARIEGQTAVLQGTATVTGLGAGSDRPFTATITPGGPGATLVLKVSGLTFNEIVLDGQITF